MNIILSRTASLSPSASTSITHYFLGIANIQSSKVKIPATMLEFKVVNLLSVSGFLAQ